MKHFSVHTVKARIVHRSLVVTLSADLLKRIVSQPFYLDLKIVLW